MAWNDGKERKTFEAEQKRLRKIYLEHGMTEEAIQALYEFDKEQYNARRRNAIHTQSFDLEAMEGDGDEGQNPLYAKFLEVIAVNEEYIPQDRFGWIETIENQRLVVALKKLKNSDLEVLTQIYVEEYSQKEVAAHFGVTEASISKKIRRIKNFLQLFLKKG